MKNTIIAWLIAWLRCRHPQRTTWAGVALTGGAAAIAVFAPEAADKLGAETLSAAVLGGLGLIGINPGAAPSAGNGEGA